MYLTPDKIIIIINLASRSTHFILKSINQEARIIFLVKQLQDKS